MEVRIYRSLEHFSSNKTIYCARIECPDAFDFSKCLDTFRSIYGNKVTIVFLCV